MTIREILDAAVASNPQARALLPMLRPFLTGRLDADISMRIIRSGGRLELSVEDSVGVFVGDSLLAEMELDEMDVVYRNADGSTDANPADC
jgi:hypothetical protein